MRWIVVIIEMAFLYGIGAILQMLFIIVLQSWPAKEPKKTSCRYGHNCPLCRTEGNKP